jgi:glycosyltransferase involved in cell wall biosynthesis
MTVALDVGPLRRNPAGVGVYVRSLAQALAQIGREDIVYIGRRSDAEGLPDGVRSLDRRDMPYPLWVELLGGRDAARAASDVHHFTDGLVPLIRRRPTIVSVMDLSLVRDWRSHRTVRYARIPLVLAAPRLADRVIAISRATADEIMRLTHVSARRIHVIPLAARASARPLPDADVEGALRNYGVSRGGYLLIPGTIEPRKNHIRILRAFEQLIERKAIPVDMDLVVAGGLGWRSNRAVAALRSTARRNRVRLLGYVPEDDLAALMTGAAAVVYASTYEGFGLPVLEAMACGAVVVTSNVSSMPEVAGDAAILVDPFEPSSIASGIQNALIAGAAERRRSVERAATFSWARTATETAAIYDTLA